MSIGTRLSKFFAMSIDWNQRRLPENTLEMQLKKVEEEIIEGREKAEKGITDVEEIADVFIATAGIGRFDLDLALHLMIGVFTGLPCTVKELADAVESKLKVIEERPYEIQNGVYRHPTIQ